MTIRKLIIAAALAAPAAMAFASPAAAQAAGGIATADPTVAVGRTKAFVAANQAIRDQFKSNLDQITAKEADRQKALQQLDRNQDKQVDEAEFAAARAAKNPALTQYETLEKEINDLTVPPVRAQAFAIEMILQRYREAQQSVVTGKKISVILTPQSFVYMPDSADVTDAITTTLDTLVPSVPITAPANWRPTRETVAMQQELQQLQQYAMAVAAQQRQGGTQPAAGTPAPAAGQPAARPATQQPPGR